MSRRVQQRVRAKARAEAARARGRNARERAQHSDERGRHLEARVHRNSAQLLADAAADAEILIELDQQVEGDQLKR